MKVCSCGCCRIVQKQKESIYYDQEPDNLKYAGDMTKYVVGGGALMGGMIVGVHLLADALGVKARGTGKAIKGFASNAPKKSTKSVKKKRYYTVDVCSKCGQQWSLEEQNKTLEKIKHDFDININLDNGSDRDLFFELSKFVVHDLSANKNEEIIQFLKLYFGVNINFRNKKHRLLYAQLKEVVLKEKVLTIPLEYIDKVISNEFKGQRIVIDLSNDYQASNKILEMLSIFINFKNVQNLEKAVEDAITKACSNMNLKSIEMFKALQLSSERNIKSKFEIYFIFLFPLEILLAVFALSLFGIKNYLLMSGLIFLFFVAMTIHILKYVHLKKVLAKNNLDIEIQKELTKKEIEKFSSLLNQVKYELETCLNKDRIELVKNIDEIESNIFYIDVIDIDKVAMSSLFTNIDKLIEKKYLYFKEVSKFKSKLG
jgi:hypothetical protein